jgi:tetratricopeptide (TPR) repeat protein
MFASQSSAGELTPEAKQRAKQHYESGERAFRLGDFKRAVTEWRESFDISGAPLLLYNIAQAMRQQGDNQQALFFYRQYLAATDSSSAEERKVAKQKVAELEIVIAAQQRAQQSPPTGAISPESAHPL